MSFAVISCTSAVLCGALVIAAVYMLGAVRNILHGPLPDIWAGVADAKTLWCKLPYGLLLACLLIFGCFPGVLSGKIEKSVAEIVKMAQGRTSVPLATLSGPPGKH
jgi:NADH:ubiquinone oxidoreductase subunit 4 (subunit M)